MWLNALFQSIIMREKTFLWCAAGNCTHVCIYDIVKWWSNLRELSATAGMLFCKYKVAEKRYTWQSVIFLIKMTQFLESFDFRRKLLFRTFLALKFKYLFEKCNDSILSKIIHCVRFAKTWLGCIAKPFYSTWAIFIHKCE